ncbi:MAG TPA: dihydrolipoyl dehydrogenase [Bacillales bacterium]|nr:dihydrolipoyl dehydrogenase [Bacillales bacterium]
MVVGEVAIETDVVVIGGGPGGYTAAIRLSQLGKSVVLIEKNQLGGVCLNQGCIPSKALIHATEQFYGMKHFKKMGIDFPEKEVTFNLHSWRDWKNSNIAQLNKGIWHLCKENGVTVVTGKAAFLSDTRLRVESSEGFEIYKFEEAIIATGSKQYIPTFLNVDGKYILNSTSALELEKIPESLSIIGGGYIGVELGMAFAKLGTQVTIVEMADRVLPQVAEHFVREVIKNGKKLGIIFKISSKVEHAFIETNKVHLHVSGVKNGETETIVSDHVMVAIGRIPNTLEIGLEQVGIATDERGYITADHKCRTNVENIFAIGDITAGPSLAHRASRQGIVAAEVIAGLPSAFDSLYVPYIIFSDPQIAGVGLTREEAEHLGYNIKIGVFPFRANGRALVTNETKGFAEVIVDAESHVLLGMHIIGPDASNLIAEGILAVEMAARVEDIALTMHPHPTLSEVWLEAAEAAIGHAIHILNK